MRLTSPKQRQGLAAERAAEALLVRHGLRPLARNVHCRMGEIDLVMRHREMLVFVEVRYRASTSHGGAAGSVDWKKRMRMLAAARWYLVGRGARDAARPCRFDVVTVSGAAPYRLEWIEDAFRPDA